MAKPKNARPEVLGGSRKKASPALHVLRIVPWLFASSYVLMRPFDIFGGAL